MDIDKFGSLEEAKEKYGYDSLYLTDIEATQMENESDETVEFTAKIEVNGTSYWVFEDEFRV